MYKKGLSFICFRQKNDLDIGWTRTRIVRIEGTYDDHLTTTKANLHLFGQVNY